MSGVLDRGQQTPAGLPLTHTQTFWSHAGQCFLPKKPQEGEGWEESFIIHLIFLFCL